MHIVHVVTQAVGQASLVPILNGQSKARGAGLDVTRTAVLSIKLFANVDLILNCKHLARRFVTLNVKRRHAVTP